MNLDDIAHMVREADRWATNQTSDTYKRNVLCVERFAALVASAEREECAKVCEVWAKDHATAASSPGDECTYENCDFVAAASDCAAAIRARGQIMINDGCFAFPVWELNGNGQSEMTEFGMTLRDWFAGLAMQGLLAAQIHGFTDHPANGPFASIAYEMADAMLKAREGE